MEFSKVRFTIKFSSRSRKESDVKKLSGLKDSFRIRIGFRESVYQG